MICPFLSGKERLFQSFGATHNVDTASAAVPMPPFPATTRTTPTHIQARAALVFELFVHKYSPIQYVPRISCPIMFVAATEDVLCPVDQVHRAVKLAKQGQLLSRVCTHFELYRGALFEGLIQEQVQFFRQVTGLANSPAPAGVPGGDKHSPSS